MKKLLLLPAMLLFGCTQAQAPSPVLQPLIDLGCAAEKMITGAVADAVATGFACASPPSIQASIQTTLGNVNICNLEIPSTKLGADGKRMTRKVKDITQAEIDEAKANLKTLKGPPLKGVVGNLLCPLVSSGLLGFLTNSFPSSWQCTKGGTAGAASTLVTDACEAAVPI